MDRFNFQNILLLIRRSGTGGISILEEFLNLSELLIRQERPEYNFNLYLHAIRTLCCAVHTYGQTTDRSLRFHAGVMLVGVLMYPTPQP